jgi:hypothetical protein
VGIRNVFWTQVSFEKISMASQANSATSNRRFEFEKRRQLFICSHNETLSVVAVIPLPKCRMIRENSRRRSKSLDAIRRVSLESGKRSSLSRRRRKSHECGLAAMEFRLKVDYENIKLRFI